MLTVEEQIRLIAAAAMDALDLDTAAERRATPRETVLDHRPGPDTWSPVQFTEEVVTMIDLETPDPPETRQKRPMRVVVARILAAAAAVVAIVFVVIRDADDVAPSPAVAPTVAPTTVAPTLTTLPPTLCPECVKGEDGVWRHPTVAPRTETGFFAGDDGVPVTFTVPGDWGVSPPPWFVHYERGPGRSYMGVAFWDVGNIYAEGCQWVLVDPPVGPTVDDLVAALANVPGLAATAAVDVTVDGYAGKQIEFTVPRYSGCKGSNSQFALWQEDGNQDVAGHSYVAQGPTAHNQLWILDVGGTRLVITAWYLPDTSPQERAALDEVLASIQIG